MCICISKLIKYPLVIQERTQGVPFAGFGERDDVDPVMAVDCVGEVCVNENLKPQPDYIIRKAIKVTTYGESVGIGGMYATGLMNPDSPEGLKPKINFPIAEAKFKSARVEGVLVDVKGNIRFLVDLVKNGRARPGFIFSNEYNLEETPTTYRRFEQHQETRVTLKGLRKQRDERTLEIRNGSNGTNGASGVDGA